MAALDSWFSLKRPEDKISPGNWGDFLDVSYAFVSSASVYSF